MTVLSKKIIDAVFIDRDGTIGGDNTIHYPGNFSLFPFTERAIYELKSKNIKVLSFTNQPGISQGKSTILDFKQELKSFGFDAAYICPHNQIEGCSCRKPASGLLLRAAEDYTLNLQNCVVVGDNWSDIEAAAKVGAIKILVKTGAGLEALEEYKNSKNEISIDYIAVDLLDAIRWILDK